MGASVVLYRGIEKTINKQGINLEEQKDIIADLFIKSGFMLPEDLMEDLYLFYLDAGRGERPGRSQAHCSAMQPKPFTPTNSDSLRELAYHLVDVIDLFDMDYDEKKDPLVIDEWVTIKNLFSNYADDIDDELLTYIMQLAIEKGAFDGE